ncbi:MAG: pentapeptide repeat-containing protein [Candidatus Korobacteraceae bacterium]
MHSRDPQKSDSEFQQEFETILTEAADRNEVADFTRYIFPSAQYAHREFKARCWFDHAQFTQKANFEEAAFTQDAIFSHATFGQNAIFDRATFVQSAYFYGVTFTEKAHFCRARFMQDANFEEATFTQEACFLLAEFTQKANFKKATFAEVVHFIQAQFSASAAFRETIFRGDKKRLEARLKELGLKLEPETDDTLPGPVFSLAQFFHPEAIVFYKTYLGQALFHNCDISRVTFSSVEWRRRKPGGKRMVFEEVVGLGYPLTRDLEVQQDNEDDKKNAVDSDAAEHLKAGKNDHDERDYGLIAELYQQLKKNYDDRKDYWTAGDFHYGEMEMKRRHSSSRRGWVRWLHENFGLAAWYRRFSAYGESYLRPFLWWLIVFFLFALLLYPLAGLAPPPSPSPSAAPPAAAASAPPATTPQSSAPVPAIELSYRQFGKFVQAHPGWAWFKSGPFFGHCLMTALSVGSLQREHEYEPSYPWGQLLALVQLVFTSTLLALFLLALRRQFKR